MPTQTQTKIDNSQIKNIFKTDKITPKNQNSIENSNSQKVQKLLQIEIANTEKKLENKTKTGFNQTEFILKWSKFTNGVAQKHQQVTAANYPNYDIKCITNGVHLPTWTSPHLKKLFGEYFPKWREDNFLLKMAGVIPLEKLEKVHQSAKKDLFEFVKLESGIILDQKVFTIGFARRAVAYKRADFILTDLERLQNIAEKFGGLQIIFSGKAHPNDQVGRIMIQKVFEKMAQIKNSKLKVIYLANYNMQISSLMVGGCDLWLNNPTPPLEASGTSGMKAELNGVPNLSIRDGWWLEGHLEGITGWAIGEENSSQKEELDSLYQKLENQILPIFGTEKWLEICRNCISLNAAHFGTNRVVMEYLTRSWN